MRQNMKGLMAIFQDQDHPIVPTRKYSRPTVTTFFKGIPIEMHEGMESELDELMLEP